MTPLFLATREEAIVVRDFALSVLHFVEFRVSKKQRKLVPGHIIEHLGTTVDVRSLMVFVPEQNVMLLKQLGQELIQQ